MWTAFFQADGEIRHTIAVRKFQHSAQHEADEFIKRMTNPEVGLWWVWVEGDDTTTGEENNEGHLAPSPKVEDLLDVMKIAVGPYGNVFGGGLL